MTTHVKFCNAEQIGGSSIEGRARVAQTLSETGTSQATTITALADEIAVVTSTVDIHVNVGAPAGPNVGDMIGPGQRLALRCSAGQAIHIRTI